MTPTDTDIYGLVAEFKEPEEILAAVKRAKADGYRLVEAYTPFPVHGMYEALEIEDPKIPWTIFIAGVLGATVGYGLQYVVNVPVFDHLPPFLRFIRELPTMNEMSYPVNVGGKPFHSWPNFIPIAYETTILFAAIGAFLGVLIYNGLPRPYHPIFNAPRFDLASQDRFFLCIQATDPNFDYENTWQYLQSLGPENVAEVES